MFEWGYAWIDRYFLRFDIKGLRFKEKPQRLSEVWQKIRGVGNVAIIRLTDMKVIYERGM